MITSNKLLLSPFYSLVQVDEISYSLLSNFNIGISILDMVPTLKNKRIATQECSRLLHNIIQEQEQPTIQLNENNFDEQTIMGVITDSNTVFKVVNLVDHLYLIGATIDDFNIYHLVRVAHMLSNGKEDHRLFRSPEFDKVINIILLHDDINPLLCSVLLNSIPLIDKYIDDKRSNKIEACLHSAGITYSKILYNILPKLLLYKEIFQQDIYVHILLMRIM